MTKNLKNLSVRKAELEAQLAKLNAEIKAAETASKKSIVTAELRRKVADAIVADSKRTVVRENGYKWPTYIASKIWYAAKNVSNGVIDPAGMSENTVITCAKAYGFIK